MRYVIVGAGAVGATLGACLHERGRPVVFVQRGEHGRRLTESGLRFATPDGTRILRIPTVASVDELSFSADDVLILAVKSQDTDGVLDALQAAGAPLELPIVCAQNGVENERRALRRFANVHGMCLMMAAQYVEPGLVSVHETPLSAVVDVGRYPRGCDAVDDELAADFNVSSLGTLAVVDVMATKYAKLLTNLGNVIEAASGNGPQQSALRQLAVTEALACFAKAGITVAERGADPRFAGQRRARVEGIERGGGSTWQSLARGSTSLETDTLNGEIVLLGRLNGVATPLNALLQQLGTRLVRERIPAGSVPIAELERAAHELGVGVT